VHVESSTSPTLRPPTGWTCASTSHGAATPSTRTGLVHLAASRGLQDAMKERLMRAYFTEGERIGDPEVLVRLGREVGLSEDDARDALATDRYVAEVREDESTAMSLGISAVPFFVVDRRMGAAGAHPPDALLELLRRGSEARPAIASGDAHRLTAERDDVAAP
jgi:predicted DsbA family dithiol-disulfide isomerase